MFAQIKIWHIYQISIKNNSTGFNSLIFKILQRLMSQNFHARKLVFPTVFFFVFFNFERATLLAVCQVSSLQLIYNGIF